MAICQLMVSDFMRPHGEGGYDAYDLIVGIDYCEAFMADGYTKEPFHGYDLEGFIEWAKARLPAPQPGREESR